MLEKIVLMVALCLAYVAQTFLGAVIVWWTLFMHELGHFLAARLVGADVHEVRVGNGARLITFRLCGARWELRPLAPGGTYSGMVTCCITGGSAFRRRWATILLAGPLFAVVSAALVAWLLYFSYCEAAAKDIRSVTVPLMFIFGIVLLAVLWQNFVPRGAGDESSVAHDMTKLAAIRRMTSIDEVRAVAGARRQVWIWSLTDKVLAGEHSAFKGIEIDDLSLEQETIYHWLRTVASWDFAPDDVLESMDRYDELVAKGLSDYETKTGQKVRRRAVDDVREALMIHRAATYAGLHSRDATRTEELAKADELSRFVDSKREPSADLLHSRGFVLMQMGRLAAARERLLRAFALPTTRALRAYEAVYLATCYVREGRGRDARYFWLKALALDPVSPAVRFFGDEILQGLEELGVEKGHKDRLVLVEWLALLVAGAAIVASNILGAEQFGEAAGFVATVVEVSYALPLVLLVLLFVMRLQHVRTRIRDRRVDFTEAMAWRCGRTALAFTVVCVDAWLG